MQATGRSLENFDTLKKRTDFLHMTKRGKSWVSKGFVLQAIPSEDFFFRVGFTVSKKVDKSAVRRNRIRRRLKSVAAEVLPAYAKCGTYVFIGRKEALNKPYSDLVRDLKWCLRRLEYTRDDRDEGKQL